MYLGGNMCKPGLFGVMVATRLNELVLHFFLQLLERCTQNTYAWLQSPLFNKLQRYVGHVACATAIDSIDSVMLLCLLYSFGSAVMSVTIINLTRRSYLNVCMLFIKHGVHHNALIRSFDRKGREVCIIIMLLF